MHKPSSANVRRRLSVLGMLRSHRFVFEEFAISQERFVSISFMVEAFLGLRAKKVGISI
tara:strand:- start:262 stop:438 length:177 start_codon:yes stop_codon:yes gene_type:complete